MAMIDGLFCLDAGVIYERYQSSRLNAVRIWALINTPDTLACYDN